MQTIRAELIEPVPIVVDFSLKDRAGQQQNRKLTLKPWTIRNEIEITDKQNGQNVLTSALNERTPKPIFLNFLYQLEDDSFTELCNALEVEDDTPDSVADTMVDRLAPQSIVQIGNILQQSQIQAWPDLQKKSPAENLKQSRLFWTLIGWLFGAACAWAWHTAVASAVL